jgi:hypothetical protein
LTDVAVVGVLKIVCAGLSRDVGQLDAFACGDAGFELPPE